MAYNFTTNLTAQNPARFELADLEEKRLVRNDPSSVFEAHVTLELRAGNSGNNPAAKYGEYILIVRNGQSDLIRLTAAGEWIGGNEVSAMLTVVRNGRATATGLTDLLAAWRGGTTAGRLNAALTALKTMGVIDQTTLAGSAP